MSAGKKGNSGKGFAAAALTAAAVTAEQATAAFEGTEMAQIPVENIRQEIAEQGPQTVAEKLYAAITRINEAKQELDKLQAQYAPGHASWHQCETIDDHLFEALRLLGQ